MAAPIVGVTANTIPAEGNRSAQFALSEAYVQAVIQAGGIPLIVPPAYTGSQLKSLFARLDGILFSGGSDIDPVRFAGKPHPRVYGIDAQRDEQEIELVQMAAEQGKPFLGICRGIQVVNVALGGTLYTDIDDQMRGALKHDCFPDQPRDYLAHSVMVTPDSRLSQVLQGQTLQVNSLHHQGVERLAPPLKAVAQAEDDLIEGVELEGHPFGLAVQWHPECLQAHAAQRALFRAFVEAAAK